MEEAAQYTDFVLVKKLGEELGVPYEDSYEEKEYRVKILAALCDRGEFVQAYLVLIGKVWEEWSFLEQRELIGRQKMMGVPADSRAVLTTVSKPFSEKVEKPKVKKIAKKSKKKKKSKK